MKIPKMFLIVLFCFLFLLAPCDQINAQQLFYRGARPYSALEPVDPELKDLQWNRYSVGNFTILSIDDNQGKWLSENIEKIRAWCLNRWGFPDIQLAKECRIFCVPNKELLKKLFSIEDSRVEIRDENNVIWLVLDDKPAKTIPVYLTQIALVEFEQKNNVKLGWWFKRGSSVLNGIIPDVRKNVSELDTLLQQNQPIFVSEKMFTLTEDDYKKESPENQLIFDRQAVALCIMLRKEFGEAKLQGFLRISGKNNAQDVLKVVYGFDSFSHFDKQYIKFMRELTFDVLNDKTPDAYLEIKPVH